MSFQDKSIQCSDCGTTFTFVGLPSLSALGNRSSSKLKALPMSLGAVPHAVEPKKHSVLTVVTTATVPGGECFVSSTYGVEKARI
jgi:hypothetical protein